MNTTFNWIKKTKRLAQPDIFFYCGLYLLVLLFCGTIEQKYIGLYQAQSKYFSSFFFWLYIIPLPAGWTVIGVILTSLCLKTAFYTKNIKKHIGSFITHTGVIFLLAGGFITGLLGQEGYIRLPEGEQSPIVSDYHKVELAITDRQTGQSEIFKEKQLRKKNILNVNNSSLSLQPEEFIKNTEPGSKRTTGKRDL